MSPVRPALLALSLLALASGAALAQSSLAPAQGSLPPPRPSAPPAAQPVPGEQPRNLAAPPARRAAPATTPTTTPTPQPRAATPPRSQPSAAPARPSAPNPPGRTATPTVGRPSPPPNRRPAAAPAGAAAAAAAAAAARPPEPTLPPSPAAPSTGSVTGLPLPRFASLRSDEVNMRVGPSTSYPIEWTFQRRDLPVQIIGEFQLWRRIRDPDGAEGWVHSSTLAGRRTVLVRPAASAAAGAQPVSTASEATLRRRAEEGATAVARISPGVIARIRECAAGSSWCEVQVASHRGFLRRAEIWGVGSDEEVK
ncbi:SH3 domain-containing protein [Roseomonas sp. F4]